MNYCTKCVLPETFPGISFDDAGTCNYCRNIPLPTDEEKKAHLRRFEDLINEKRGSHAYDVLLAFSGGKDSSYNNTVGVTTIQGSLTIQQGSVEISDLVIR